MIQDDARVAGKKTSRYIFDEILGRENRMGLSAEELRTLRDRVNRLLLLCEDLARALPGTDVTLGEAVAFLFRDRQAVAEAAARRIRRRPPGQRETGQGMDDLFGEEPQ